MNAPHPIPRPLAEAGEPETAIDRTLRLMRRQRRRDDNADRGSLMGLGSIKQMVGGDREALRGILISLVARGDVEVCECTNGTFWRAFADAPKATAKANKLDGHYILQREVFEGGRQFWFDAESFDNSKWATAALEYASRVEQAGAAESGSLRRPQRVRLLKLAAS